MRNATQRAYGLIGLCAALGLLVPDIGLAGDAMQSAPIMTAADYPQISGINSRNFVWVAAQLHLFFGAFVLAVPIFALAIEMVGHLNGEARYDRMARDIMKASLAAYSLTALLGGTLALGLLVFYPTLTTYMARVFSGQYLIYAIILILESVFLYLYYYSWDALRYGNRKWVHLTLGLMLNTVGLTLMFVANSWATFMMAPSGVNEVGVVTGSIWEIMKGPLWNPLNLHRFIANIAFGGSIVGALAAFRFLAASREEEKAHYDWMGYTSNIIALVGFLPLPFAGYWLMAEIYAYSQQMGITAMGGVLAWMFIIQAVLIGSILLAGNYYLWCGMGRTDGGQRYIGGIKWIALVIVGGFLVWVTPHSLILTPQEIQAMGGTHHKLLGPLGIMPAKNIAVNLMILFTFLSFQLYRRAGKEATVSWASMGNAATVGIYLAACINIVGAGIYGYFTPTVYKVGASVPQVVTTLTAIIACSTLDAFMYKGARLLPVHWGRMSVRSQYALFVLPVAFTWLMALMGYVRSAVRTHWHVYAVVRDNSPDAYIPTVGQAGNIVTLCTVLFMMLIIFIFWLSSLGSTKQAAPSGVVEAAP